MEGRKESEVSAQALTEPGVLTLFVLGRARLRSSRRAAGARAQGRRRREAAA